MSSTKPKNQLYVCTGSRTHDLRFVFSFYLCLSRCRLISDKIGRFSCIFRHEQCHQCICYFVVRHTHVVRKNIVYFCIYRAHCGFLLTVLNEIGTPYETPNEIGLVMAPSLFLVLPNFAAIYMTCSPFRLILRLFPSFVECSARIRVYFCLFFSLLLPFDATPFEPMPVHVK